MREMMVEQQDVFYYVTLMNENLRAAELAGRGARRRPARLLSLRLLHRRRLRARA